jgi:hypothetical protein
MSLTYDRTGGGTQELYTVPTALVLCGLQGSKMGCGAARDEELIEVEEDSVRR